MIKYLLSISVVFFVTSLSYGQQFYNINADFSIKEKLPNGKYSLTIGTAYYNKNFKKLIYKTTFPNKEWMVFYDTTVFRFDEKRVLITKSRSFMPIENTIFHLALNNQLSTFGLSGNPVFKLEKTVKEGDLVIATWAPQTQFAKKMGKILVSTKNKLLYGVVIMKPDGTVASKFFYKGFKNYSGLFFPEEVVTIIYNKGKENYQITTFKNILINAKGNNDIYNFSIPR